MMKAFSATLVGLLGAPAFGWAAEAAETGDLFAASLKMLGALGLVLGLILGIYALSRRGVRFLPGVRDGAIKVVEVRHLGPKKTLYLVEVRGEELLLGAGANDLNLLARLGKPKPEASFEQALASSMGAEQ